jgi:hypothetical protein
MPQSAPGTASAGSSQARAARARQATQQQAASRIPNPNILGGELEDVGEEDEEQSHVEEEQEESASFWLSDPPEGFGHQLSHFGRMYSALDGWISQETLQHICSRSYLADMGQDLPSATSLQVC